jgi:hypothetical protein
MAEEVARIPPGRKIFILVSLFKCEFMDESLLLVFEERSKAPMDWPTVAEAMVGGAAFTRMT